MAGTIFDGDRETLLSLVSGINLRAFLELLLDDDLIREMVVDKEYTLVLEFTQAVKPPYTLLVVFLRKIEDRVVYVVRSSIRDQPSSCANLIRYYEDELVDVSLDGLISWMKMRNAFSLDLLLVCICEAVEAFWCNSSSEVLPLRFAGYFCSMRQAR